MQKRVLGLTGPTGAGKSKAAQIFLEEGCTVIDCDCIARQVTNEDSDCLAALVKEFGSEILFSDQTLNRKKLAEIAFSSRENELKLNAITHPPIMKRVRAEISKAEAQAVILDAPLLFESGADALCSKNIVILAQKELRLERIMKRDQITKTQALSRMAAQQPDAFYRKKADLVFENNEDAASFETEVRNWIRMFLRKQ